MGKLTVGDVLALELQAFPIMLARPQEEVADLIALYALKLSDLDPDQISAAFELIGGKYPPSYHEIREAIARINSGQIGEKSAEDVWGEVLRECSRVGAWLPEFRAHYETERPGFTPQDGPGGFDDATQRAISAVGWNNICLASEEASKAANRKRFIDAYTSERARVIEIAKLSPASRALVDRARLRISGGSGTLAQLMGRKDKPE